jgi:4-amino-4-deoxy-L-arabinose transferase-like glycosyltransferase
LDRVVSGAAPLLQVRLSLKVAAPFKNQNLLSYFFLGLIFILWSYKFIYLPNFPHKAFSNPDEVHYMVRSLNFHQALHNLNLNQILKITREYPPFIYLISSLVYSLTGTSMLSLFISYSIFIFIFILALYWLGCWLGEREYGWLLVAWGLFSPPLVRESSVYLGDLPVLALLSLSLYLLLKARHFTETRYALALGLVAGLGLLTKFTFIFYWLPLLLCEMLYKFKDKAIPFLKFILSLSCLTLLGLGVSHCCSRDPLLRFIADQPALTFIITGLSLVVILAVSCLIACRKDTPLPARNLLLSLSWSLALALPCIWCILMIL